MKFIRKGQFILLFIVMILLVGCDKFNVETTNTNNTDITTSTEETSSLSVPSNVVIENETVIWDHVVDSNEYIVIVGDEEHTVTTNSFDLTTLNLTPGYYQVSVKALNDYNESDPSIPITYIYDMTFIETLLSEFNETYVPNMSENDFIDIEAYEEYTIALMFSVAYENIMLKEGISKESAIQMITKIKTLSNQLMNAETLVEVKASFDGLFIDAEINLDQFVSIFLDLADVVIEINLLAQNDAVKIERLNQLSVLLTDERDTFIRALKSVADYTLNVYGQMDQSFLMHLNNLLAREQLTTEEIFILKQEIYAVLQETLPSVEDYENTYTVYSLIMTLFSDNPDASIDEDLITTLSSMTNLSNQLYIDFIGEIDQEVYNNLMLIIGEMNTPGSCDYGTCVRDLILFIDKFFNDFKTNHQTTINQLNYLHTDEIKNKINEMLEELMIALLEVTYTDEVKLDAMIVLIERLFDNFYIYEDAFAVCEKLGVNAYNLFIDTDGQIITDIHHVFTSIKEGTNPSTLVSDFQHIFSQYLSYHEMTLFALEKEDLTSIIRMVIYTSEIALVHAGIPVNNENFVEPLIHLLPVMIYPYIQFQKDFINNLDQNNRIHQMFDDTVMMTLEESVVEQIIMALNESLTHSLKQELIDSVYHLYFDVYGNEIMFLMLGMTEDDIRVAIEPVLRDMNEFFTKIEHVASFDFQDLTEEQNQEIAELIDMLPIEYIYKDESEMFENAHEIILGSTTDEAIETIRDIDYFKFVINETKNVSIYTNTFIDLYGYLFDASLNLIDVDNESGEGSNFKILATLEPGTYYIKVKAFDKLVEGEYQLIIEEVDEISSKVIFADYNLEVAIRQQLGISSATIREEDCLGITTLNLSYQITDLSGIEYFVNLETLNLQYNQITDLSPLSQLTSLQHLNLLENHVTDISPLSDLTNLKILILSHNDITEITHLSNLISLEHLNLEYNNIDNLSPLIDNLGHLSYINLGNNNITDISMLTNLPNLNYLNLQNNDITDISALKTLYDDGAFRTDSDDYYHIQLYGNINLDLGEGTNNASIYEYLLTNGVKTIVNEDDYANNPEEAYEIELYSITYGRLEHEEDKDYFKIEIFETCILTLYTSGNNVVSLYDELMSYAGGDYTHLILNITLEPGIYYIVVEGYEAGEYQLVIEEGEEEIV